MIEKLYNQCLVESLHFAASHKKKKSVKSEASDVGAFVCLRGHEVGAETMIGVGNKRLVVSFTKWPGSVPASCVQGQSVQALLLENIYINISVDVGECSRRPSPD